MRGKVIGLFGLLAVGALGIDCGPPPVPLTANINFSISSMQMLGGPPPVSLDNPFVMVQNGQGVADNTMLLRCFLQRNASGSVTFNVVACRTQSGVCNDGRGITFCGEVAGAGQEASRGRVSLYVGGAQGTGQIPGNCHIQVDTLTNNRDMNAAPNSIAGQIWCTGIDNTSTPGQTLSLQGRTGANPSMDPSKADFDIVSCTTTQAVSCM